MTFEGPFEDEFEYESDDDKDDAEGEEWKKGDYDKSDGDKWKDGSENEDGYKDKELPNLNKRDKLGPNGKVVDASDKPKKSPEQIEHLKNRFKEINKEINESELIINGLRVKRDSISAEIDRYRGVHEVDLQQSKLNDINKAIYRLEDEIEGLRIEMAETHNLLVDNE